MKIRDRVIELLDEAFIPYPYLLGNKELSNDEKLNILPTESMLALEFVTSLEDEFDIEFEDDDLDIDFFDSIDNVNQRISILYEEN